MTLRETIEELRRTTRYVDCLQLMYLIGLLANVAFGEGTLAEVEAHFMRYPTAKSWLMAQLAEAKQ